MTRLFYEEGVRRFWARVDKENGPWMLNMESPCWIWTGRRTNKGYGQLKAGWLGLKDSVAHRVSYKLAGKNVQDGFVLDHLCRITSCVNDDHMEPVTSRTNVVVRGKWHATSVNAAKTHCVNGHFLDDANTQIVYRGRKDPSRRCKTCEYANQKRYSSTPEAKAKHAARERIRKAKLRAVTC